MSAYRYVEIGECVEDALGHSEGEYIAFFRESDTPAQHGPVETVGWVELPRPMDDREILDWLVGSDEAASALSEHIPEDGVEQIRSETRDAWHFLEQP